MLEDAQNYRFSGQLQLGVLPAFAEKDIRLDLGPLSVDMLGAPLQMGDLEMMDLFVFPSLSAEEIAEGLLTEGLEQRDTVLQTTTVVMGSEVRLSSFGIGGHIAALDLSFSPGTGLWVFRAHESETGAPVSFLVVEPSDATTEDQLAWTGEESRISGEVDLSSAPPVLLASGADPRLDWSGLTRDALGGAMADWRVSSAQILHFDMNIDEVQQGWPDLHLLEPQRWTAEIGGQTSALLSDFVSEQEDGTVTSPTVDDSGVWMLSLNCEHCQTPLPRAAFVLQPEGT